MNKKTNSNDEKSPKSEPQKKVRKKDGWFSRNKGYIILSFFLIIVIGILGAATCYISFKISLLSKSASQTEERLAAIERKLDIISEDQSEILFTVEEIDLRLAERDTIVSGEENIEIPKEKKVKSTIDDIYQEEEAGSSNRWAWYVSLIIILLIFGIGCIIFQRIK